MKRLGVGVLMMMTGVWSLGAQARPDYQIQLLGQTFTPTAGVSTSMREAIAQRANDLASQGKETIHVLVQLYETPGESEKLELGRQGLDLGAYVPNQAFIATVPVAQVRDAIARPQVRYVSHWDASRKVHPRIKARDWGPWTRDPERPDFVMVFLQLHKDVALEAGTRIAEAAGGVPMAPVDGLHGMTVWIHEKGIDALAANEEVLWIQEGPAPLTTNNDGIRNTMQVNPVAAAPYSLDGTGVRVFVFDGGAVRRTHETFNSGGPTRVTVIDGAAGSDHPTHVAGTVAGDGAPTSAGGRGRGVAPGANILSGGYSQSGGTMLFWDNAGDIQNDYTTARGTHTADMGTNSIGSNTANNGYPCAREGDYDLSGSLLDGIIRGNNASVGSAVLMTWANGNERSGGGGRCGAGYRTTAPPSCAKNPIHVGATNSDGSSMTTFSSWGPCDDGRLKPIVSAPGCETGRVSGETSIFSSLNGSDTTYGGFCGTSMATPAVAGTVALFIQDWRAQGHGGANDRPLPALVKAMLIHSARDLGQEGPDFIYGYGTVEAKPLIDLLRAGSGELGDSATGGPGEGSSVDWGTGSIAQNDVQTWTLDVPFGTGELKATLAWDDAAAAAFAASAPVNNLKLELVSPGGTVHNAWILSSLNPHLPATRGVNNLDNQEQVLVSYPQAGEWTVRVTGSNVPTGPQTFGLVYTKTPATHYPDGCTTVLSSFEGGTNGWTLSGGAARAASPATGHGSFSIRLTNAVSTPGEATMNVTVPTGLARAEFNYWWYKNTTRTAVNWNLDTFLFEVRDPVTAAPLAVFDLRTDGWQQAQWMQQQKIDLTPWAGQTIRLAFRSNQDASQATTVFVDDAQLITCAFADIYGRDYANDNGAEPSALSPTQPTWTSPDVWVRADNDSGLTNQPPAAGQLSYINARVRNRGSVTARDVNVRFYVAETATALAWPADWTPVGTARLASLAPGAEGIVRVPWTPATSGHYALLVRLDTGQDPMKVAETAITTDNARQNNNVYWRNVHVMDLANDDNPLTSELKVRNLHDSSRVIRLGVEERGEGAGPAKVKGGAEAKYFHDRGTVTLTLDATLAARWASASHAGAGFTQINATTIELNSPKAYIEVTAGANEEYTVEIEFDDPSATATATPITYSIDVNQKDVASNKVEGGITYLVDTSPSN